VYHYLSYKHLGFETSTSLLRHSKTGDVPYRELRYLLIDSFHELTVWPSSEVVLFSWSEGIVVGKVGTSGLRPRAHPGIVSRMPQ